MQPNMTAMIAIKKDYNIPVSSIRFKNKILGWATNENSKNRFKTKFNLWTIQSNETFAKKIIKKYKKRKKFYLQVITKEFLNILGLKNSDIFLKNYMVGNILIIMNLLNLIAIGIKNSGLEYVEIGLTDRE